MTPIFVPEYKMSAGLVKTGVIGCGNISSAYLEIQKQFAILDVVAVADLDMDRARRRADEFDVPRACSVAELLGDDEIRIVLNLTTPTAHTEVNLAAIEAGKHVYTEKPLAVNLEDGRKVLDAAAAAGLLVGSAPDTFMGAGHQTARKLIDDGWIGRPVAACAFMTCRGHEGWHPDPEFYYKVGGGPMLDMGPYYLTDLVNLLGPVARVCGSARKSFPTRTITADEGKYGQVIDVEVPTHVAGTMDFECGAVGTVIMSFDIVAADLPSIEVYGSEGTLSVPDPNCFGGPVYVQRSGGERREVPLSHIYADNTRSIGPADMALALSSGRQHRACGELAFHVLEVMEAFDASGRVGKHVEISTRPQRPDPLPLGLLAGELDE